MLLWPAAHGLLQLQQHLRVKVAFLRVVVVLNLYLLVHKQEQLITRVQVVLQDQLIKIQHHIQMLCAKHVLPHVVVVLNFLLVQQQQIDLVKVVLQD